MIVDTSQAWERAAVRAKARNVQARWVQITGQGHDRREYWLTNSVSNPGAEHHVLLEYTAEGISAVCDCEGGQSGKACQHVAAALEASEQMRAPAPKNPSTPADWVTHIVGQRLPRGVSVCLVGPDRVEDLPHVDRHSPDGFEWGFSGSGPADLAFSILLAVTGDSGLATGLYQGFKQDVVSRLEHLGWVLSVADVRRWIETEIDDAEMAVNEPRARVA